MIKIQIIGTTASGKTTIGHEIFDYLKLILGESNISFNDDGVSQTETDFPIYNHLAIAALKSSETKIEITTVQASREIHS